MSTGNALVRNDSDYEGSNNYSSKPAKSWRTLTFFKSNGLMIRFDLTKQAVYLSFIDKTSTSSYQSFNDGFVIKLDLFSFNELLFCLNFTDTIAWESWREKNSVKYQIVIQPFKLQSFSLTSRKTIDRESYALKLAIYSNKTTVKQFILSPYEYILVKDLLTAFRNRIVDQFSLGVPPA